MSQYVSEVVAGGRELAGQFSGDAAFFGFDDGASVVSDQPAQLAGGSPGATQVPSAVERVEAGVREAGNVADVMQPCGGGQQIGVRVQDRGNAAGLGGDALTMRPPAGQRQLCGAGA